MKPVIIIVIAFVLLIPTTVFAQQLSISISANPVPVEYQGNDFTVNFEGELFNNGKIYWSVYDKNSSNKPGQQLVILPTDTKLWTKTVPAVYFPSVGQTYIFEIKNGNVIETFEFIVQKKINAPLESLSPFFDSCENGLWIGHFKNEKTGEQIQSGKVFLYDDKGQRTKTTALFPPEGYLKIYPNGNEDSPPVHWVLVRSGSYEDLEFQPVCVELPSWIKSTALWWSEDAITNDDFITMIQFLIQNQIILVSTTDVISDSNDEIPTWIKTSAQWWGEGTISDMEFLRSIEYMVNQGIITIQSNSFSGTAQENNVLAEVVECRVTNTGNYVKVGISVINMNPIPVDVEYVLQTFDNFGKLLTMESGRTYDLNPSSTQFEEGMLDNIGSLHSCAVHINKVSES